MSQNILLTPAEMLHAERIAISRGVSGLALMEAAGRCVAATIKRRWARRSVVVLCGPGNNGGDGFVAARRLKEAGWPVRLGLLGSRDSLKGDAARVAAEWDGEIEPLRSAILEGAELVVDAIFGAGLSRPIEGVVEEVIEDLVSMKLPVVAVDVPSGLDGATGQVLGIAPKATVTVTFSRKKPGHLLLPGRTLCGQVEVADIGLPEDAVLEIGSFTQENGPELWLSSFPWPQPDSHKYKRGQAMVVGGAVMTGATRLAVKAAGRAGAGLVTVAVPPEAWPIYAASLTSAIVQPFSDDMEFAALLSDPRRNAILIGPGAGVGPALQRLVAAALATGRAVVLDADALTAFGGSRGEFFGAVHGDCVLTPHPGEFARLFDVRGDKLTMARHAAKESGTVVLLKGADTVIAAPDGRTAINTNAPPDLATAGSGDVLSGIIAGLLAQGMGPFRAACAAAWMHAEAAREFGPGLLAEDLIDALPKVLRRLKELSRDLPDFS